MCDINCSSHHCKNLDTEQPKWFKTIKTQSPKYHPFKMKKGRTIDTVLHIIYIMFQHVYVSVTHTDMQTRSDVPSSTFQNVLF